MCKRKACSKGEYREARHGQKLPRWSTCKTATPLLYRASTTATYDGAGLAAVQYSADVAAPPVDVLEVHKDTRRREAHRPDVLVRVVVGLLHVDVG